MAHPRPLPDNVKAFRGNPGRRPLNNRAPRFTEGASCPSFLDAPAKREWRRIAPQLIANRLLTRADRAALAAYCQLYSRWQTAAAAIAEHGLVNDTPQGVLRRPEVGIEQDCLRKMLSFAIEFGFTPAARTRVMAPAGNDDDEQARQDVDYFGTKG